MNKYHTIIIGAGPAGYSAALKIAEAGKAVCLIDKSEADLGGTCLNTGCIPTKSFLESANLYQKIKSAANFGVKAEAEKPNLEKIKEKANNDISLLKKGLLSLLKNANLNLEFGEASFLSANKISLKSPVTRKELEADNFILATGSKPKNLPGLRIDNERVFDSSGLCRKLPGSENILIVGGGYIGCEFAHFYSSLGFEVTVAEVFSSLLPGQDKDAVRVLEKEFLKKGVKILTSHEVVSSDFSDLQIKVELKNLVQDKRYSQDFGLVIVSAGRVPKVNSLNLEAAGLGKEAEFIKVDSRFRTETENIYAVGDLINSPMLAHAAFEEAEAAAESILKRKRKIVDYNLIPHVVFSEPQVASFGLSEKEAKSKNIAVETKKKFFRSNPKACVLGKTSGFIKLIFTKDDEKLLGASIVGAEAGELIHILTGFAKAGLAISEIGKTIYAHPTLSEIFSRHV